MDINAAAAALLAALPADVLPRLAEHPLGAIPRDLGIRVELRPESTTACSVDGSYYPTPPRISVATTASVGRRNFTALHELGHHLIYGDDELGDLLAMQPDGGRAAEEQLCDSFAAEILIPQAHVENAIGAHGLTAAAVIDLYRRCAASRSACAAAVARQLLDGYVIIATTDGTIVHAAQAKPTYVIRPGTRQPASNPVTRAGVSGRARGTGELRFATGTQSPSHHIDAERDDDYVFAIVTRRSLPWVALNLLPDDAPTGTQITCEHCDYDGTAFGPACSKCGDRSCPTCERCGCGFPARSSGVCEECFLTVNAELLSDGLCPSCA